PGSQIEVVAAGGWQDLGLYGSPGPALLLLQADALAAVGRDDLAADGGGAAQGHAGAVAAGGQAYTDQYRAGLAGAGGRERRGWVAQPVVGVGLGSDGLEWVEGAVAGRGQRGQYGPAGPSLGTPLEGEGLAGEACRGVFQLEGA